MELLKDKALIPDLKQKVWRRFRLWMLQITSHQCCRLAVNAFVFVSTMQLIFHVVVEQVDDVVVALDESLRPQASGCANDLRRRGRVVDLILENRRMKWVFKVSDGSTCTQTTVCCFGIVAVVRLAKRFGPPFNSGHS